MLYPKEIHLVQKVFSVEKTAPLHLAHDCVAKANNNPQQNAIQNAIYAGLVMGMVLGFISMASIFKGVWHLIEAIKYFRGDPSDHLLILYHDLVIELDKTSTESVER